MIYFLVQRRLVDKQRKIDKFNLCSGFSKSFQQANLVVAFVSSTSAGCYGGQTLSEQC